MDDPYHTISADPFQPSGSPDALQRCSSLSDLATAIYHVDLEPLLSIFTSGPNSAPRRGRRTISRLPMVRAFLIASYPGSGVAFNRVYSRLLAGEDALRQHRGFDGALPDRKTFTSAFRRLDRYRDQVDAVLGSISELLRNRPWRAPIQPQSDQESKSGNSGNYRAERERKRYPQRRYERDFPDEESAERWFIETLWPDGVRCPRCGSDDVVDRNLKPRQWRCRDCRRNGASATDFSVKSFTVMHSSNLPLLQWVDGMYDVSQEPKGISAQMLSDRLNVSYGTALHLWHRMRRGFEEEMELFLGPTQFDEMYYGGREGNKHANKKLHAGRGPGTKTPIIGVVDERTNRMDSRVIVSADGATVHNYVRSRVVSGAMVYSDEHAAYRNVPGIAHESVTHSRGEYVRDFVTTNWIESHWALVRRGFMGNYHQASLKHLPRYATEFKWRHNHRPETVRERMESIVRNMRHRRMTLKEMRAGGKSAEVVVNAAVMSQPPQLEFWPSWP